MTIVSDIFCGVTCPARIETTDVSHMVAPAIQGKGTVAEKAGVERNWFFIGSVEIQTHSSPSWMVNLMHLIAWPLIIFMIES